MGPYSLQLPANKNVEGFHFSDQEQDLKSSKVSENTFALWFFVDLELGCLFFGIYGGAVHM